MIEKIIALLTVTKSWGTALLLWASIVGASIGFLGGSRRMKWSTTSARVSVTVIIILGTLLTMLLLYGAALDKGL